MENPRNQLVERIKNSNNVLITVSTNPSVDQLSAAIGLTLMLNKLKKHATTVYSGSTPSVIEFLKPDETIEANTDSLRDFIISLDKSKADKIRYKVEDTMVKIFITPYRTSIDDEDLVFSQGDFNVDVVVALGVQSREDLDQAITNNGRILHDATVSTVNTTETTDFGSINWTEPKASSLCEMIVGISDMLQEKVLDEQMATALLTGIVAETEQFSNHKTTSVTMNASAKLMTAGANQQLVAKKLDEEVEQSPQTGVQEENTDLHLPEAHVSEDGSLQINHEHDEKKAEDQEAEDDFEMAELPELPEPSESNDDNTTDGQGDGDRPATTQESATVEDSPENGVQSENHEYIDGTKDQAEPTEDVKPVESLVHKGSRFVSEPPQTGSALSAMADKVNDERPPLAPQGVEMPLLTHDKPNSVSSEDKNLALTEDTRPPVQAPDPTPTQQTPADTERAEPAANQESADSPPLEGSQPANNTNTKAEPNTLKDIEAAVESPHQTQAAEGFGNKTLQDIENTVDNTHTSQPPASPDFGLLDSDPKNQTDQTQQVAKPDVATDDQDKIRQRIDAALATSTDANSPPLEPISALGAGGRMDISHDDSDSGSSYDDEQTSSNISIDQEGTLSFPENLVPKSDGPGKDETAAPNSEATSPPPVPPPMMMPPVSTPS